MKTVDKKPGRPAGRKEQISYQSGVPGLIREILARHTLGESSRNEVIDGVLINYDRQFMRCQQAELRGLFTLGEVLLLADVLNGYWLTWTSSPFGAKPSLIAEVADGIEINKIDEKWDVDGNALIGKIQGLNEWTAYVLTATVCQCWKNDDLEAALKLALAPVEAATEIGSQLIPPD